MRMFCTTCGGQLMEEHRFCPQCGKPAGEAAQAAGSGPGAPPPPRAERRLVRPMYEKSIGGVCAGFANYLDMDVTLMRLIWLCTAIFTGVGFLVYLVCWIVMPKGWSVGLPAPQQAPAAPPQAPTDQESSSPA